MITIVHVGEAQIGAVRQLFLEYADFLGFDLGFQSFSEELESLPGEYSPPEGRLLLAIRDGKPVGCVALRKIDDETCEMKRLFVRSGHRGSGLGRLLAEAIIQEARLVGYRRMRLDTVPALEAAIGLYGALGFREIPPYRYNPIEGATFWEMDLNGGAR